MPKTRLATYAGQESDNRTDVWLTPPQLIKSLGHFDLDPCAATCQPWSTATTHYTEEQDGLRQPWLGRVWLNPPYSNMNPFIDRFIEHKNGVALVYARTGTRWFFKLWDSADAMLFLAHRLSFHAIDGSVDLKGKPADNVLVAFGEQNVNALVACGYRGALVTLPKVIGKGRVN